MFNNLSTFAEEVPADSEYFDDLYEVARTGGLNQVELQSYVDSMVTEYDKRVIGNYFLKEGMEKTIIAFKRAGASDELIAKATGLTPEQIAAIER